MEPVCKTRNVCREFSSLGADDMFGKLRILASLRAGEKLSFNPLTVDLPTISCTFMRWWNREGRAQTIDGLKALYTHSFELIEAESNSEIRNKLIHLVSESTEAINALESTYNSDHTIVGTLQGMGVCVDLKLKEVRKKSKA